MIWPIVLFICGVLLLMVEFFVPGGLLGVAGFVCLVVSTSLGVARFPEYAGFIIGGEFVAAILVVLSGFYILPRSPFAKLIVLNESQRIEEGWSNQEKPWCSGDRGEVYTQLRPAGTVIIDGKRVSAVSNGTFIAKGTTVRVVEVHGNRVVVEENGATPSASGV